MCVQSVGLIDVVGVEIVWVISISCVFCFLVFQFFNTQFGCAQNPKIMKIFDFATECLV